MNGTSTMAFVLLAVVASMWILVLVIATADEDSSEPEPGPEPSAGYVKVDIEYTLGYKNTHNGDVYVMEFDAPADGYAVIHHGSTGWMEEHIMFHEGHDSLVIERYSSVGRPTAEFYIRG